MFWLKTHSKAGSELLSRVSREKALLLPQSKHCKQMSTPDQYANITEIQENIKHILQARTYAIQYVLDDYIKY